MPNLSDDEDFEWEDTPPPAKVPVPTASSSGSGSKISKKVVWNKEGDLQKIMGNQVTLDFEREDRHIQLEREIHKERIAADEKRLEVED